MSTFYLVRHAHADWTPDENRPLSAQGSKDAAHVATILCEYPIDAIYSSPFRRARETILPLAEQLDLSVYLESDLREQKLGDAVFEDFLNAVEANWQNPTFAHPGGESTLVAQQRGITMLERLLEQYPNGHIVLSTHGNLLALILQAFDPSVDFMFWKSMSMPDVFQLTTNQPGRGLIRRLWQ